MIVGTPWPLPLRGAIALIEEVGEKPYEIDRYLTQLALTGELGEAAAVMVGDLTRCARRPRRPAIPIRRRGAARRCSSACTRRDPAAVGAPVGHGDRNEAVPFGADAMLDLDARHARSSSPAKPRGSQ